MSIFLFPLGSNPRIHPKSSPEIHASIFRRIFSFKNSELRDLQNDHSRTSHKTSPEIASGILSGSGNFSPQ